MALILMTAFIAVTALALPNSPSLTGPLRTSGFPVAQGVEQNIDFLDLTFTTYPKGTCQGGASGIYTGVYGFYVAHQMQSYRLTRDLFDDEALDFYSGSESDEEVNNTLDPSKEGHYTLSCWLYDATAGFNATTQDRASSSFSAQHHGRTQGCHTLNKNEWYAIIWKIR